MQPRLSSRSEASNNLGGEVSRMPTAGTRVEFEVPAAWPSVVFPPEGRRQLRGLPMEYAEVCEPPNGHAGICPKMPAQRLALQSSLRVRLWLRAKTRSRLLGWRVNRGKDANRV